MLQKKYPLMVKLICGFIYSDKALYKESLKILEKKYGSLDYESHEIDFNFTDYYYPEMGSPLYRRFISFKKLQKCEVFNNIKNFCIKIEQKYSKNNKRTVNIDPGYINEAKLVLTTTKDFSHRIYIGKGIYAEVTLFFNKGLFCEFPTTFPDYRSTEYKNIFHLIRDIYRKNIKK